LRFSHVAATTQKTAGHGTRGVTRRGKGVAITRRRTTMGAPNGYGDARKSQKCHKYFLQYRTYASKRPLVSNMGAKIASCPGRHTTLLRLCMVHVTIKVMEVNLTAHEVSATASMNKKI